MSAYLARLKQLECIKNSHYVPDSEPSKPSKVPFEPFEPFEGTGTGHIEKKIIDAETEGAHFLWAVESKDGGIFLAAFTPPSTLAEVLIDFPNAVTATPEKQRNGVWNAH